MKGEWVAWINRWNELKMKKTNTNLTFIAILNLPDLAKMTNDPIDHDPTWTTIPSKLPLDIPMFEGKQGDDPTKHVMSFHLWCSSNNIVEESVRLCLFQ